MNTRRYRRWTSFEGLGPNGWDRHNDQPWISLLDYPRLPQRPKVTFRLPVLGNGVEHSQHEYDRDVVQYQAMLSSQMPLNIQKTLPPTPHHIFEKKHKRYIVYIVSFAGLFSPLSSNIYFPALGNIARQFHETDAKVALTITIYMIFQGLAPSFWGSLADTVGRRPVFIGTFIVYLLSNIALAFSPNWSVLMAFRALQAIGSSATISIGAGVISDITTPAERGGLIGAFGGIRMLGQAIGPAFGGILTQYLGFRSIFYFLFILAFIALATIIVLLPETLRNLAGNGTIALHGWHRPLTYRFFGLPKPVIEVNSSAARTSLSGSLQWKKMILSPLSMLSEKDVFVTLLFGSIVYAVWSMVTASTTQLFQRRYHLTDLVVGFAFLPNGLGCVLGSYLTGRLLDHDFRAAAVQYRWDHNLPKTVELCVKGSARSLRDFPIEHARLRSLWWHIVLFCASTAGYGLSLSTHLAVPLILQFISMAAAAYTATSIFSSNSTLLVDLYPDRSASATAVNNLARCSVGAVGVAIVDIMLAKFGPRWTFAALAGITVVMVPLVGMEWAWGRRWRNAREVRDKEKTRVLLRRVSTGRSRKRSKDLLMVEGG